jgi:hypothetical protein
MLPASHYVLAGRAQLQTHGFVLAWLEAVGFASAKCQRIQRFGFAADAKHS